MVTIDPMHWLHSGQGGRMLNLLYFDPAEQAPRTRKQQCAPMGPKVRTTIRRGRTKSSAVFLSFQNCQALNEELVKIRVPRALEPGRKYLSSNNVKTHEIALVTMHLFPTLIE